MSAPFEHVGVPTLAVGAEDGAVALAKLLAPLRAPVVAEAHDYDEEDPTVNPELADTARFCPVTLAKHGVLRPCPGDFAVKSQTGYYHCASEEAQAEFLSHPELYHGLAERALPPARFWFIGPASSGKTTQANQLAAK
jgi:hypothetical protein